MGTLFYHHPKPVLTLIPASCIHYPVGDEKLLRAWVKRIKDDPTARTILMGDMIDQDRTHMRKHRKSYVEDRNSRQHDDRHVRRELEDLIDILSPIKDKIICALEGNHFFEFSSGITSDQILCDELGVPFMGSLAAIRVGMSAVHDGDRRAQKSLVIWAHHSGGSPGGRTTGGSVNALGRHEASWDADVYLMGHDHRRITWRESQLAITTSHPPKVVERTKVFARVGAFLKGFEHEGCAPKKMPYAPSYAEEKALRPTDLGWVEIKITLKNRGRANDGIESRRFNYDLVTPGC